MVFQAGRASLIFIVLTCFDHLGLPQIWTPRHPVTCDHVPINLILEFYDFLRHFFCRACPYNVLDMSCASVELQ